MVINRKFLLLHLTIVVLLIVAVIMVYPYTQKDITEKNSVPVYFVKSFGENDHKILYIRRKIYKGEDHLKIALSELLRGPDENEKTLGYYTEIPEKTSLIDIQETPERITVNLSQEFDTGGGSDSMQLRLRQLIHTALDSAKEKPVYLQIDSQQVKFIGGEGVIVPQPLSVNLDKGQDI